MIIGISGKKQTGKDTVGHIIECLCSELDVTDMKKAFEEGMGESFFSKVISVKFADKLKDMVCLLIGCSSEDLEDERFKNTQLDDIWWKEGEPITPRIMLQKLGTDAIRNHFHKDTWVNATLVDYDKQHMFRPMNENELPLWIVTDMRFPNELKAIKDRNGITIRVNRLNIIQDNHPSETALDESTFDYIIHNDGDMNDLVDSVYSVLQHSNII